MFILPELPYDYSALEPYIDTETMRIHHDKHHATYVKNLNDLLAGQDDLLNMDINDLLKNFDKVPEEVRQKVINNAGGVANHNMFWKIMIPNSEFQILNSESGLAKEIIKTFGSFNKFKEDFTTKALGRFGSGWAWLVVDPSTGSGQNSLRILDTGNQVSPITNNLTPILALDVWEHAYYLKYKNVRVDYITNWWNVVNWSEVEKLYEKAGDSI